MNSLFVAERGQTARIGAGTAVLDAGADWSADSKSACRGCQSKGCAKCHHCHAVIHSKRARIREITTERTTRFSKKPFQQPCWMSGCAEFCSSVQWIAELRLWVLEPPGPLALRPSLCRKQSRTPGVNNVSVPAKRTAKRPDQSKTLVRSCRPRSIHATAVDDSAVWYE